MVGMDSHFYEQTSPLSSSFDLVSKASSQHSHHHHHRVPKCVSPALSHVAGGPVHGSEVIPTDLNTPELTFDHMSIQQFIRSNEINGTTTTTPNNNNNNNSNNTTNNHSQNHNHNHNTSTSTPSSSSSSSTTSSTGSGVSLEESVSIFSTLINVAAAEKGQLGSSNRHQLHSNAASTVPQSQGLSSHSSHYTSSSYQPHPSQHHSQMPQQPQLGTDRYGLEASSSVKQEPLDSEVDFSSNCSQNAVYTGPFASNYGNDSRVGNNRGEANEPSAVLRHLPFSLGAVAAAASVSQGRSSGSRHKHSSKKNVDKGSDEYKKRRERNNIAVRKSREKAKIRSRETEKKVSELARENDQLRKKVDSLCKELNVLKSLLTTVGVPPESVDSEIEKGLQMESHLQGGFGAM